MSMGSNGGHNAHEVTSCVNSTTRQREKKKKDKTVLCCSPTRPKPGQIDLFPRQWCYGCVCSNSLDPEIASATSTEDDDGGCVVSDLLWKVCFFSCCCPTCYPCYVTRSYRKRDKGFHSNVMEIIKNDNQACPSDLDLIKAELIDKGTLDLHKTFKSHVYQSKRSLLKARSAEPGQTNNEPDCDSETSHKETSEEDEDRKVITVNVIVLRSRNSLLLNKALRVCDGIRSVSSTSLQLSEGGDDVFGSDETDGVLVRFETAKKEAVSSKYLSVPNSQFQIHSSPAKDHQRRSPGRKSVVPRFSFDLTAVKEASLEEQEEDDDLGMEKEPIEKIEEEEITEEAVVDEETQSVQEEVFEDCVSLLSNHPSPNPTPRPSIVVKDESGANCRVLLEPRTNVPRRQSTIKLRFAQGNRSFRRLFRSMSTTKSPRPSLKVTTTDCQLETPVIGATTSPSDHLSPNAEAKSPSPSDRSGMSSSPKPEPEPVSARRKSSFFGGVKLRRRLSSTVQKRQRQFPVTARQRRRKFGVSEVDGGSITDSVGHRFYSYGPQSSRRQRMASEEPLVEVQGLGNRTVILRDLGFQIGVSFFDEASLSEWDGHDLRRINELPNMDIIVLAVKQNDVADLETVMNTSSGLMSYFIKFWSGFYPMCFIELLPTDDTPDCPEFRTMVKKLSTYFGDFHHLKIKVEKLDEDDSWINECLARLFIHSRIYQCSRFFDGQPQSGNKCPGGCELTTVKGRESKLSRKLAVKQRKSTMKQPQLYRQSKLME